MSQPAGYDTSNVEANQTARLINNYISVSACALVSYDYFLTLPLEISEIWTGTFTATKALFFLNRYSYLLYQIVIQTFYSLATDNLMQGTILFSTVYVNFVFHWTYSTFAIYRRNKSVLLLLTLIGSGILTTNVWSLIAILGFSNSSTIDGSAAFCSLEMPKNSLGWYLANYSLVALFDTSVFCLTLYKTLGTFYLERQQIATRNALLFLILKDGIIYYFTLVALVISGIILVAVSQFITKPTVQEIVTVYNEATNAIQWLLVNRLVLNLSRVLHEPQESFRTTTEHVDPVFPSDSVLGNIGAQLRVDDEEYDDTVTFDVQEGQRPSMQSIGMETDTEVLNEAPESPSEPLWKKVQAPV